MFHFTMKAESQKKESELLIMAYTIRFKASDAGLDKLLKLLNCHLPADVFRSKYLFLKEFPDPEMAEYYYCDACLMILNFEERFTKCTKCDKRYDQSILREQYKFFTYINSKLYASCRKSCSENDIINGKVYLDLRAKNIIGDNDVSMQWNVDGVNLFKSSKMNTWPILVTVNELPYKLRKNNVMLCGL